MKNDNTKPEKVNFYEGSSSMDDVIELMNVIDPDKDSKYFTEIWNDIEDYKKRIQNLREKEENSNTNDKKS